jgi:hypothetical protein
LATRAQRRQEHAAKLGLVVAFLGAFAGFAGRAPVRRRHARRLDLPVGDLLLLVGATFRLGRLIAFDKVFDPLRAPWSRSVPDETGAGETVEPVGEGARRAVGELLTCPICAGTWVSAGLVYALHWLPGPTRVFMTIMSVIGLAEVLNALTEHLSWTGQSARKEAGNGNGNGNGAGHAA